MNGCTSQHVPTPYVNRSLHQTPLVANWAARAFGTFVTAASGNTESGTVTCALLRNGLCVGAFDYKQFDDQSSHRRMQNLPQGNGEVKGSSWINVESNLERPHLLGPGNHDHAASGVHLPAADVNPGTSSMRHAAYTVGGQTSQILGTSFAAPAMLSVAIQAHQFKGWFSDLFFPMVNKAVLLSATRDANADGAIGKGTTWSDNAPNVDAEDGAGQINLTALKITLTNNQFVFADLADSQFASCGTSCREYVVTWVTVAASVRIRAALAWQACMIEEGSIPSLNNDLDLLLDCGSPFLACGGTTSSTTVASEIELLERPGCHMQRSCAIKIRIKNGAALAACGSTPTERVGIAWSFNP